MSYKLYTDKDEKFKCQVYLEGASLTKSKARLIVESNGMNLMFNGKVDKDGKCEVPIKKLKNILDEGDKGNVRLEIIADDTYFEPWESDFIVKTNKKVKVKIKEQEEIKKPKIKVTGIKNNINPINEIAKVLVEVGVTKKTFFNQKKKLLPIIEKYLKESKYKNPKKFIIELVNIIDKI